jgi:ATP/maltotriose-dependent transcriptional regulator MalT
MPSPTPILATKLYMPPLRPEVVSRPRLLERLNEGLRRHLVLISAPAGFGKTTLVSHWLALIERPAAWLSLDEGDNDPARFLTYLVAALQTIAAHVGEGVLGVLQSPQPPPTEAILTTLLNDLTSISDQDAASFITSFTGSHHFVMDYLLEEVLEQQPESVQAFLLRTSILERLCGPLCDAILLDSSASGQATLELLDRATCSSSPWTTSGIGTAVTISSRTCCDSDCARASQAMRKAR